MHTNISSFTFCGVGSVYKDWAWQTMMTSAEVFIVTVDALVK